MKGSVSSDSHTGLPNPTQNASNSKKKNDLQSTFKNDVINGELDLSNRSKLANIHSLYNTHIE